MRYFKRVTLALDNILMNITGALFLGMLCFATIQVISRYIFNHSFEWAEEYARFFLVYIILLGAAPMVRRKSHVVVSIITNRLRGFVKWFLELAVSVINLAFFCVMTFYGYQAMMRASTQYSTATDTNMGLIYAAVPLAGFTMILFGIEVLVDTIQKFGDSSAEPSTVGGDE